MVFSEEAQLGYLKERGWTYVRDPGGASGWSHPTILCDRASASGEGTIFPKVKMHKQRGGGGVGLPSCQLCGSSKAKCSASSKGTSRRYHWRQGEWIGSDLEYKNRSSVRVVVVKEGKFLPADHPSRKRLSISAPSRKSAVDDTEVTRRAQHDDDEIQLDLSFYPADKDMDIGPPESFDPESQPNDEALYAAGSPGNNESDQGDDEEDVVLSPSRRTVEEHDGARKKDSGNGNDEEALSLVHVATPLNPPLFTINGLPPRPHFSPSEIGHMRDLLANFRSPNIETHTKAFVTRLAESLSEIEREG